MLKELIWSLIKYQCRRSIPIKTHPFALKGQLSRALIARLSISLNQSLKISKVLKVVQSLFKKQKYPKRLQINTENIWLVNRSYHIVVLSQVGQFSLIILIIWRFLTLNSIKTLQRAITQALATMSLEMVLVELSTINATVWFKIVK